MRASPKSGLGFDAAKLTAAKVITLAIGMVSTMLLSRFRSLEEYGTYSQINLTVSLAVVFLALGLPNSINYFLGRSESAEEQRNFLSSYYTLTTLISIALGVGLFFISPLISRYYDNSQIQALAFAFILLPWSSIAFSGFDNVMVVKQRTTILVIHKILNGLSLLAVIAAAYALSLPFRVFIVLYLTTQAVFAIAIYVIVARVFDGIRFSLDFSLLKEVFAYSIPLGIAGMVGTLSLELDKLMIGRLMNTEALALYTNAGRELPVTFVTASMTAVLMPRIVRLTKKKEYNKAVELWRDATVISYYIICFFSAVFIIFAPQVISLLYSEVYLPGVPVFRVYSLVLLLRTTYFGIILNAIGKTKLILVSSIGSLLLNIPLNYIFFQTMGFVGPAFATLVSILLVNSLQLFFTGRQISVGVRDLIPWREIAYISLINIVLGMIVHLGFTSLRLGTDGKSLLITVGIGCVWSLVYFSVIYRKFRKKWVLLNSHEK